MNKNDKSKGKDKPEDDISGNTSGSEEDDENDSDEEEEDEDQEEDDEPAPSKKKKETPPQTDEEFHKAYLKEKIEMDKLLKETMIKDEKDQNAQWWQEDDRPGPWARPQSRPQSRPNTRPWGFSGNGDSAHDGGYFGDNGGYFGGGGGGRPSRRPYFRGDKEPIMSHDNHSGGSSYFASGPIAGISSFFNNLFGFGASSLTHDPWFPSAARDLTGDISPGIAV